MCFKIFLFPSQVSYLSHRFFTLCSNESAVGECLGESPPSESEENPVPGKSSCSATSHFTFTLDTSCSRLLASLDTAPLLMSSELSRFTVTSPATQKLEVVFEFSKLFVLDLEYAGASEDSLLGEKILVSFVDDSITDELAPLDGEMVGLTTSVFVE